MHRAWPLTARALFAGFLLKADCEGEPGPATYGRSELEGANAMADVLAPVNAITIWRAFAHPPAGEDQALFQFNLFKDWNGQTRENVRAIPLQASHVATIITNARVFAHMHTCGLMHTQIIAVWLYYCFTLNSSQSTRARTRDPPWCPPACTHQPLVCVAQVVLQSTPALSPPACIHQPLVCVALVIL